MSEHEKQGTGFDPGAGGHELQGRRLAPGTPLAEDFTVSGPAEQIGTAFLPRIPYLVIDCETTGLLLFNELIDGQKVSVPADDPRQPYLAQIAMIELDADFGVLDVYAGYVKPDGWTMGAEAGAVNGLTNEFLTEYGRPIAEVLDNYEARLKGGPVVIAHNAQFDAKIMRGALRRAGRADRFEETYQFCTMREWAKHHHCKWPKLVDLCTMLGIQHEGPHKAIADVKATAELLPHFRRLGIEIDGRVHRSKYHTGSDA